MMNLQPAGDLIHDLRLPLKHLSDDCFQDLLFFFFNKKHPFIDTELYLPAQKAATSQR